MWQNAGVLFSKYVAVIISVSQLGCFVYLVAVITVDSAQPRVLKKQLEFYSPALRGCGYS